MNDLISREAVIEHFQRIIDATNTDGRYNLGFIDGLEFCINHLSTMPSEQPEQKKGKWIKHEDDERISGTCSCCGWDALLYETDVVGMPFCPNCGAEMEEELEI